MKRIQRVTALLLAAAISCTNCPLSVFVGRTEASEIGTESQEILTSTEPTASEPTVPETSAPVEDPTPEAQTVEEETETPVEIVASGTVGSNVTWSLDTAGKLVLSGTGAMWDYTYNYNLPWYNYRSQITAVVLEDGVTTLGNNAFYNGYTNLASVSLPETMVKIGANVFRGCTALTRIDLPDGITTIGSNAFYGCTNLTTVSMPDSLTTMNGYTFYNCTSLTGITIPAGVTSIGNYTFYYCTGLTEITIPEGVTSIGGYAFYKSALTELAIPAGVTSIGNNAFQYCTSLAEVTISEEAACSIGTNAFYGCTSLTTLDLGGTKSISNYAFQNCNLTGELVIPDSVKSIYNNAFRNNKAITAVTFGSGLKTLGNSSSYMPFEQCSGVVSMTFTGETAPSIPGNLVYGMSGLKTISVPSAGYTSYAEEFANKLTSGVRLKCPDAEDDLVIVDQVLVAYQGDDTEVEIPDGVTAIGPGAFANNQKLTAVTIPDSVTVIGNYAFSRCTALKDIALPDGITAIGKYAFYYCQVMTMELNLTDALTQLGTYAFYYCQQMTGSVYISDAITQLEAYVFYGCSALNGTLRLSENLTAIGDYAFYGCAKLTGGLNLPATLKTIGTSAFYNCSKLSGEILLPTGLTSLGGSCFSGCSGFTGTLVLPEGLTSIPSSAFYGCTGFTGALVIPDKVKSIGSSAFNNCQKLTSVVIPSTVTSIGSYVFSGASGLKTVTFEGLTVPSGAQYVISGSAGLKTIYVPSGVFAAYVSAFGTNVPANARILSPDLEEDFLIVDNVLLSYQGDGGEVVIPDNVTAIGTYAFNGCDTVTKITIPDTVTTIGAYAFRRCAALTEINLPESLEMIPNYMLFSCPNLAGTIRIPDSVMAIGTYAFAYCYALTGVNIGDGVTSIGTYAFYNCTALKEMTMGSSVQTISDRAFCGCSSLEALDLGDSVTKVGNYAFNNCKGMKTLDLGTTVTSIGEYAFESCSGLTGDLVIPNSVTSIGNYAFRYCSGLNGTLKLSENLKTINYSVFASCSGITGEVVVPDSVTAIYNNAFSYMRSVTSMVFGTGLVTYAKSTYYDYNPVYGCTSLTEITFKGTTPPNFKTKGYPSSLQTVYVPLESFGAYSEKLSAYLPTNAKLQAIGASSDFLVEDGVLVGYLGEDTEITIPDDVTAIGTSVFQNHTAITSVVIPDTVTSIGDYAFYGCTALTTVNLPTGLTEISDYAFYGCTALTGELKLPTGLTAIGSYAFYNCKKLTGSLVIPGGVKTIGEYAFCDCLGFNGTLTLSEGVEVISHYAFNGCYNFTGELVIPDSVTTIEDRAFCNLNRITAITFGTGVTKISNSASDSSNPFCYCSGVTTVTFNGTVPPTFHGNMFYSMSKLETVYVPAEAYTAYADRIAGNLAISVKLRVLGEHEDLLILDNVLAAYLGDDTQVVIPDGVTTIGSGAFKNCSAVTSITIPDTVTAIGSYAFMGCSAWEGSIALPKNLTSIGDYAFSGCNHLTGDLVIPDSVTVLGTGAFYNCTGLNGTLKLSENLTALRKQTFYNCKNIIGTVVVPDSVTMIENNAFQYMNAITGAVIGSGVKTIGSEPSSGYSIFYGCTNLERITLTGPLPTINNDLSSHLTKLEMIHVPEAQFSAYVSKLGANLRSHTHIVSTEMNGEMLIVDNVLLSYQGVGGDVVIPEGVTSIGDYAFHGCSEVTSVSIPDSVTSIGSYAFRGCTGMTRVNLPKSLKTLGLRAFYGCSALSGKLTIPDTLQAINEYTFYGCSSLTGLDLGEGITKIGPRAFGNCTALTGDLVIPDSVTSLSSYMFIGCSNLNGSLKLSENLTSIPANAFDGAKFTGELVIPDKVTTIYDNAFNAMPGLESIVFGTGVTKIGNYSGATYSPFYNCTGVKTMAFMGLTVPTLVSYVFNPLTSLETVYVLEEAYDAYAAALSGHLGSSVVISTDFLVAKISNLAADRTYSKTINLSWNPHTSSSVVGYTISCGGEVLGTTQTCSYAVRNLESNTTYTFTVQGYTEDGRTTTPTQVTATTCLPEIRDIRTVSSVNKINDASNTISIHVTNGGNLLALGEERTTCVLYCGDVCIGEATLGSDQEASSVAVYTLDWDLTGWAEGSYDIRVCLTDVDGASVEYTETLIVDRGIPEQIIGVTAVGDVTVIHVNWATATETDTNIYRIYRRTETDDAYRLIAQINNRDTLSYTDKNIKNDRVYYYYVVGVNELNQEGVPSVVVGATLAADIEAPVVTKLNPSNGSYLKNTVTLSMTATDNIQVTHGELHYSLDDMKTWNLIARVEQGRMYTSFDTTALPDGIIRIRATAYDAAGNASTPMTYVYAIDNHGPEQVQGLSYESTHVSVTLRWKNVSDADIHYYRVEQKQEDGTYILVGNVYDTLGMNIYDLTPGTAYTYRVVGYDQQGNRGTPSVDIETRTLTDTVAPVITRIRPTGGYYADRIPLVITATDEYQIRSITVQTSVDQLNWKDVYTQNYVGICESQTLTYSLPLANYNEGSVYVRAVARDGGGNTSDTSIKAPYVQYVVDRTAPAVPGSVKAIGQCGYIEISWIQGTETDLAGYDLYRAVSAEGEYELLAEGLKTINYLDRDVTEDGAYYYKVVAIDKAGNRSEYSAEVFAEVGVDTEPPVIVTIYPTSGSLMGPGNNSVSVTATDNHMLQSLLIEYSADGTEYQTMYDLADISQYGQYAAAAVPVSEFADGAVVYLRVSATDQTGNVSEYFYASYTIDAVAPVVESADAQYQSDTETVQVTWTGAQEADLYGYRIYRVVKGTASMVGFCPAAEGQCEYAYTDANLPIEKTACTYRVEAVDRCGNASGLDTPAVEIPDRQFPRAVLYCDNTMEVDVEYVFDASASTDNSAIVSYTIDFGDGTSSNEPTVIHIYEATGEYTVTLTVEDDDGHITTVEKTITVVERAAIGTVKIQVVDENGKAIADAPVYFDLGEETQTMKKTDSTGCAIFTSTAGVHAVGCVIANNEWLPAKKDVVILAGAQTTVPIILVHQAIIEGEFEVNRMTFEEIKAAGIDVSKPENQHLMAVDVKLTFGSAEQKTSFIFNMVTKEAIGDLVYDSDNDSRPDREIVPVVLSEKAIAYLDLPIGASMLKEFFDVRLHIINNAATEFSMLDNVITLNVPEGLSIVEAAGSQSGAAVEIPEIPGQSETTISWILRGDKAGEYSLTADYSGRLSQFNEPIHTTFLSKEPIKVYGMEAVKLIAEVNSAINFDAFYFNLALENISDIDVNLPSIEITDHVLKSYLTRITEIVDENGPQEVVGDPEASSPMVRHLNTMLTNTDGYRQHIGAGTAVQTLTPGQRMTNQYAAYNVTGYNNLMVLKQAIYEIAEACGIRFELIETDMDLFSMDQAEDKLADIAGNADKLAQLDEILDCSRYFYVLEVLNRDTNLFIREGQDLYTAMVNRLAIDTGDSAEATTQVTRAIVAQLMVDESMQQAINASADGKYLTVTASLLNQIRAQLPEGDLSAWDACLNTSSQLRILADKLEKFGLAYFAGYLADGMRTAGISDAGAASITGYHESGAMASALSAAVADVSDLVSDTVEKLDAAAPGWSAFAELVDALLRVAAAQEEMNRLLDMLTDYTAKGGNVRAALLAMGSSLEAIEAQLAEQFAQKLETADGTAAGILGCLQAVYGAGAGTSYTLVNLAFGSVDQVVTWSGITTDRHVLRICTAISLALRQAVERYGLNDGNNDQAEYTLSALKYLIKMRLIGEQCFVNAMGHLNATQQEQALAWVNSVKGAEYDTLDAYLRELQVRLLGSRDDFFTTYYTNLEIPEAPKVTIDYLKGTTVEAFSSDYEYSIDGAVWFDCTGKTISFTPGTVSRYLWVRKKATGSSLAGNITKIVIPAMPRLTGDITMMYVEDGYEISGLPAGTYQYAFTNERNQPEFTKSFTVTDGEIIRIQAENIWSYLALMAPATGTAFTSQIRYLVPEKPWILDTDTYLVTGMEEKTSSMQVVNYYGAKGYAVTVLSPDGKTTDKVGTGCLVTLDGESYTALVVGDVDGNASIDLFDLMDVIDHFNSEEELEGVYRQAGQISGDDSISMVDLMDLISYLNTGFFTE